MWGDHSRRGAFTSLLFRVLFWKLHSSHFAAIANYFQPQASRTAESLGTLSKCLVFKSVKCAKVWQCKPPRNSSWGKCVVQVDLKSSVSMREGAHLDMVSQFCWLMWGRWRHLTSPATACGDCSTLCHSCLLQSPFLLCALQALIHSCKRSITTVFTTSYRSIYGNSFIFCEHLFC